MKKAIVIMIICLFAISSAMALNFAKQANPLVGYTQMHGLVIANGYIYVIAGNNTIAGGDSSGDSLAVQYASFSNAGLLGTFQAPSSMYVPKASNQGSYNISAYIEQACFSIGSTIYRIGAGCNPTANNNPDTIWAKQNTDGTLGTWGILSVFPTGVNTGGYWTVSKPVTISGNTYIYTFGGQNDDGTLNNKVFMSSVNPTTGAVVGWSTTTPLPINVYFNSCYAQNTHVYVWSGYMTGSVAYDSIYHATVKSDGTLSAWDAALLPTAMQKLRGSAVAFTNHRIAVIGGRIGTVVQSAVFTAVVNPDGSLGTFTTAGDFTVNSVVGGIRYAPAAMATINNNECIVLAGLRSSSSDTVTFSLAGAAGTSNAVFVSDPIYTMPSFSNGAAIGLIPGQAVSLIAQNGTPAFSNWTSSNAAIGAISGISGAQATFTASTTIGSTVVSVKDIYGDTASITITVSPTEAPLAVEK